MVHRSGAALDRVEGRGPRNYMGLPIHKCLLRLVYERGRPGFCAESFRRVRDFVATNYDARFARRDGAERRSGFIFPRSLRDDSGDAVHGAVSRHRPWFRLQPIARDHLVDVSGHRGRDERALFAALRATGMAAVPS